MQEFRNEKGCSSLVVQVCFTETLLQFRFLDELEFQDAAAHEGRCENEKKGWRSCEESDPEEEKKHPRQHRVSDVPVRTRVDQTGRGADGDGGSLRFREMEHRPQPEKGATPEKGQGNDVIPGIAEGEGKTGVCVDLEGEPYRKCDKDEEKRREDRRQKHSDMLFTCRNPVDKVNDCLHALVCLVFRGVEDIPT